MHVDDFAEVAKVNDISPGHMEHFELDGKEILITSVEGRFYAMDDRCGHMTNFNGKSRYYSYMWISRSTV